MQRKNRCPLYPNSAAKAGSRERPCLLTPESGHVRCNSRCPLWANSGHQQLFNHLVCATEQRQRHGEPEGLCSLKIDCQLKFRHLLYRQIDWLLTFKYPTSIHTDPASSVRKVASVTHKAACRGELAKLSNCGYTVTCCQSGELFDSTDEERVGSDDKRAGLHLGDGCKDGIEIALDASVQHFDLKSEFADD